jgi:flagellar biosynthesis/type III secretory pathway M-ring protein FliF/YscJ
VERGIEFGIRWAGPITLGLFTLWALWMFNSSLKKLPSAPPIAPPDASKAAAAKAAADGDEDDDEEDNRPLTKRDQLQGLVRENPEMAAAVISKWLAPTK